MNGGLYIKKTAAHHRRQVSRRRRQRRVRYFLIFCRPDFLVEFDLLIIVAGNDDSFEKGAQGARVAAPPWRLLW